MRGAILLLRIIRCFKGRSGDWRMGRWGGWGMRGQRGRRNWFEEGSDRLRVIGWE